MKATNAAHPLPNLTLPEAGFARLPAVKHVTGAAGSTIWLWVRKGKFPPPVKISPRMSAWRVEDVRAWLRDPAGWQQAA